MSHFGGRKPRLPEAVLRELEGLPWELTPGGKHWHLRVCGRMVQVVKQKAASSCRGDRNFLAQVRRVRRAALRA